MNMHVGTTSKFKVGDRVRPVDAEKEFIVNHWNKHWKRSQGEYKGFFFITGAHFDSPTYGVTPIGDGPVGNNIWFELAPLFAVGDKVRVANNDSGRVSYVGETGVVVSDGGDFGDGNSLSVQLNDRGIALIFSAAELELIPAAAEVDNLAAEYGGGKKFKVGDRVKADGAFTFDPSKGTIVRTNINGDAGAYHVKIDGQGDDDWFYYSGELEHVAVAPATATALRIEVGKFYKTRDGRKVGPMSVHGTSHNNEHPWIGDLDREYKGGTHSFIFKADGRNYEYTDLDLIAEWQDEPQTLGEILASALRKPTTIADIVARHSQTGTSIVCVLDNGQPKPATSPFVHADAKAAEREAERLANTNKGKEFGVYTLGSVARVEKTYDHEWQRLAAGGQKINAIRELRGMTGLGLATAKDAVEDWLRRQAS